MPFAYDVRSKYLVLLNKTDFTLLVPLLGLDPGMMNQGGMGQQMVGGGMSVSNPSALTMAGGTMTMTNGENFCFSVVPRT